MRAPLAGLLLSLAAACKDSGPTAAELAAARLKTCATAAASLGPKWEQVKAAAESDTAPTRVAQLPGRSLKLRALHESQPAGTTADAMFKGALEKSALGRCVARLSTCEGEWLESTLEGCATLDSFVLVRPVAEAKAQVDEAMLNKYKPGHMSGDALLFAFATDGGAATSLGALPFDVKLKGGVEVERDATTAERAQALDDAMRKAVLGFVEHELEALP